VKVDRVEWLYVPDASTASAALAAGEVDFYEQPPVDLLPVLEKNKDITVANIDPLGNQGVLRFNHLQPPFNNPKMRQAVLQLVDQKDYLIGIAGNDTKNWQVCKSFFACGSPMSVTTGTDGILDKTNVEKAKALVKEAGYNGEKVVVISATDQPLVHAQALITTELLKSAGINAQLDANDWGTLITRRTSKEPVDRGGWSIFHTWIVAPDVLSPALNFAVRMDGEKAWFGWPTDPKVEELRAAWLKAPDVTAQKKVASDLQAAALQSVPYVPTGQFFTPTAFRKNLEGVIVAPVVFLWNVEKK
jgi:peptide/nickel transport system substrate-binding protein